MTLSWTSRLKPSSLTIVYTNDESRIRRALVPSWSQPPGLLPPQLLRPLHDKRLLLPHRLRSLPPHTMVQLLWISMPPALASFLSLLRRKLEGSGKVSASTAVVRVTPLHSALGGARITGHPDENLSKPLRSPSRS